MVHALGCVLTVQLLHHDTCPTWSAKVYVGPGWLSRDLFKAGGGCGVSSTGAHRQKRCQLAWR